MQILLFHPGTAYFCHCYVSKTSWNKVNRNNTHLNDNMYLKTFMNIFFKKRRAYNKGDLQEARTSITHCRHRGHFEAVQGKVQQDLDAGAKDVCRL